MKTSQTVTKDPICGMTVDESTALHTERDGQTFYFCSDHCRQKFLSVPAGAKLEEKSAGCCGYHPGDQLKSQKQKKVKNNKNVTQEKKMKTLLSVLLITLLLGTVTGCQNSAKDHNMSAEEHKKM